MNSADFRFLKAFLKRRSGLAFGFDKVALGERRLLLVARRYGLKDIPQLVAALRNGEEPLATEATQAMTINDTAFFRDKEPFETFRESILPQLLHVRADERRLRIWSAACAGGQEPYSIAMILQELGKTAEGWTFDILATDLSAEMIARGRAGLYEGDELQKNVPAPLLARYFGRKETHWQISESIRERVRFQQFNLLDDYAGLGRFDVVFCRNVLLYLDADVRANVMARLMPCIAEDGYLVLGAAETVLGFSRLFETSANASGFYVKREPAHETRMAAVA